jgi:hypothetical protein
MLRVLTGCVHFTMQTDSPTERDLYAGDQQAIPPGVLHAVALTAGSVEVDFLRIRRVQTTDVSAGSRPEISANIC